MEKIGMYRGKFISQMTREELLDFAEWASHEIERLQKIEPELAELKFQKEMEKFKPKTFWGRVFRGIRIKIK